MPDPDEWVRWTGLSRPQARGGEWRGVKAWWFLFGEIPGRTTNTPTVELADGTRPPVLLLEQVWACEWHAPVQSVRVRVDDEQFDLPFDEPYYQQSVNPTHGREQPNHVAQGWFRP